MFDQKNPIYLQSSLETFIEYWYGHRKPWFGIDADKIEQAQLPQPLRWLYGFAGAWPGQYYWETLFGNQDCLYSFEALQINNGKLVFINENQGVWQVATEPKGDNPPVWVSCDGDPWLLLDQSLTSFLVTFILHEAVFGCRHLISDDNIIEKLKETGMNVAPLWLNHPYPGCCDENIPIKQLSFYIADRNYLIMGNWCATNLATPWENLPFESEPNTFSESDGIDAYAPIPEHIKVPSCIQKTHLESLIRIHEMEIEHHQKRCNLYQKMLADTGINESPGDCPPF